MKRLSPKELQIAGTAIAVLLVGLVVFLIGGEPQPNSNDLDKSLSGKEVYPIDINSASVDTLVLLPGIGPTKANAIVEYREENDFFSDIQELTNVKGIGEATLNNIREFVVCYIDNTEIKSKIKNELIDINMATTDQLQTLPGIGPEKSQAIIDYRQNSGPFIHIDDLTKVKGIGDATLNNIKDLIYVEETETNKALRKSSHTKININTAGVSELKRLPGIGDVLAKRIVEYRDQVGQFSSREEIMNVKGIGEKTYESIKELITF
ncbi:MAG: ComEA family DNA-binding protein [Thermotogota bacterium]|nr:ComEA family DNA-binding protein [Thermotogota bacterium]